MKLTKRGFLQSIGSLLATGTAADALNNNQEKQAIDNGNWLKDSVPTPTQGWSGGGLANQYQYGLSPHLQEFWSNPPWQALRRVGEKSQFLKAFDSRRSGQFTSHEEKKLRWIRKRECRRFMRGPHYYERNPESIQQWKAKLTIKDALEDLKRSLEDLRMKQDSPKY